MPDTQIRTLWCGLAGDHTACNGTTTAGDDCSCYCHLIDGNDDQ